jgi:nitrogen fixation protein NifX
MNTRRLKLIDNASPAEDAADEGEVPLRIAVATQDLENLNAHFGSARKFAIYDVTATASKFVEAVGFGDVSDESGAHKTEGDDRITPKVEALQGCTLLFVLAIGGAAAAKVVSARIHPIKLPQAQPISEVIERVQGMLKGSPPPWLKKILGDKKPRADDRFEEDYE